ncbi:uncharacterized protein LOC126661004 [Mercurialis annua]|uniref:uncharacterized protein LOC126661004 n=1 Tax=Mercurialis annua TaxID=3986 RepID=UPI0024AFA4C8|nr:uncharacterized protein LOC126661004 [Mercurialis annua]
MHAQVQLNSRGSSSQRTRSKSSPIYIKPRTITKEVLSRVSSPSQITTNNVDVLSQKSPASIETSNLTETTLSLDQDQNLSAVPNDSTTSRSTTHDASPIKKRGRGVTTGFEVKKRAKEGTKIGGIIIKKGVHLPVGPAEKIFKMEIGVLTRKYAPKGVFYWTDVTDADKQPILVKLAGEFDIDIEDPHTKKVIDKIMSRRFTSFKHRCHMHYKKFKTFDEASKHPLDNIKSENWITFCKHFEDEKFKAQSVANRGNRGMMQVPHTSGSKSYCQRLYEMVYVFGFYVA